MRWKIDFSNDGRGSRHENAANSVGSMVDLDAEKRGNSSKTMDDCHNGSQQNRQREKFAEQTRVHRQGLLSEMSATMVIDTGFATVLRARRSFMNMERRQKQHWQKHCQQHPRGYASFRFHVLFKFFRRKITDICVKFKIKCKYYYVFYSFLVPLQT